MNSKATNFCIIVIRIMLEAIIPVCAAAGVFVMAYNNYAIMSGSTRIALIVILTLITFVATHHIFCSVSGLLSLLIIADSVKHMKRK